jgi:DNA polymerase
MATNYGIHIDPAQAQEIVDQWRAANPWAVTFWGRHSRDGSYGLWDAALKAYFSPGSTHVAGRVSYYYDSAYLGGSLLCELPSGRLLTYPYCKWRKHELKDKKTGEVINTRETLVFRRDRAFVRLYGGLCAENVTQATACDLLREAIWRLDQGGYEVVLHAHDEAVIEIDMSRVEEGEAALRAALLDERPWAEGLPLGADVTTRWFYSAAKERKP